VFLTARINSAVTTDAADHAENAPQEQHAKKASVLTAPAVVRNAVTMDAETHAASVQRTSSVMQVITALKRQNAESAAKV
jgi:hypothetical protein